MALAGRRPAGREKDDELELARSCLRYVPGRLRNGGLASLRPRRNSGQAQARPGSGWRGAPRASGPAGRLLDRRPATGQAGDLEGGDPGPGAAGERARRRRFRDHRVREQRRPSPCPASGCRGRGASQAAAHHRRSALAASRGQRGADAREASRPAFGRVATRAHGGGGSRRCARRERLLPRASPRGGDRSRPEERSRGSRRAR
jgi:hypothetical protein